MRPDIPLLVYLIAGIHKLIYDIPNVSTIGLLRLNLQPDVVEAKSVWRTFASLLILVERELVDMAVDLVVVYEPYHGGVIVGEPVACHFKIPAEYIHQHGFSGSGLTDDKNVFLKQVVHVRENTLTFLMVVEVEKQESYHFRISFIDYEPSTFSAEYRIANVLY